MKDDKLTDFKQIEGSTTIPNRHTDVKSFTKIESKGSELSTRNNKQKMRGKATISGKGVDVKQKKRFWEQGEDSLSSSEQ